MKLPTIKDSQDRESVTLMFCTVAFLTMNFGYVWMLVHDKASTLTEYGMAFAAIMAPAFGRDWLKK